MAIDDPHARDVRDLKPGDWRELPSSGSPLLFREVPSDGFPLTVEPLAIPPSRMLEAPPTGTWPAPKIPLPELAETVEVPLVPARWTFPEAMAEPVNPGTQIMADLALRVDGILDRGEEKLRQLEAQDPPGIVPLGFDPQGIIPRSALQLPIEVAGQWARMQETFRRAKTDPVGTFLGTPEDQQETSREAFDQIEAHRGAVWERILDLMRASEGGLTGDEVEEALGIPHQSMGRLRELVVKGLLEDSGARRPTRYGHDAIVWRAVRGDPEDAAPLSRKARPSNVAEDIEVLRSIAVGKKRTVGKLSARRVLALLEMLGVKAGEPLPGAQPALEPLVKSGG